jgi:transglutaminase-like putative cysteine protease
LACLLPRDLPSQRVQASSLHISPLPDSLREHVDVYGNRRTFFALPHPHEALHIRAQSLVQTLKVQPLPDRQTLSPPWEQVRDHFRYRSGAPWDAATEFSFPSHYVPQDAAFEAYAKPSFQPGRPLLEAAVDLMRRIHREFEYASKSTDVNTPALQALEKRQGVCQDFAHILLACLRTLGLSARYVSGYLLTVPPKGQARLVGSDASHAWASVYVPLSDPQQAGTLSAQGQWFDLDPTNDRWGLHAPGPDFVTVALGRDFADVSPVRGVIYGGASHSLKVGVTVEPVEPDASHEAS